MRPGLHVLPLYLFPPIHWWQIFLSGKNEIEIHESWIKQTLRNRYEICGPNGRMKLIVPTVKKTRKSFADTEIDNREEWQLNHYRSLEAAYNKSPYFEFYRDELWTLLSEAHGLLWEFNSNALKWCIGKLQVDADISYTNTFRHEYLHDHRRSDLNEGGSEYIQVFQEKHGFTRGLSILDLLFNLGPEAASFVYSTTSSV